MSHLVKKMSTKTVYGKVKMPDDMEDGERLFLYRVAGVAKQVRRGETAYGDWVGFKGDFACQTGTGEEYRSNQCFLPEPFQGMLENAVEQDKDGDGKVENVAVRFSVDIYAKKRSDLSIGYEYEPEPVIKADESDIAQTLLQSASEQKALPTAEAGPKSDDGNKGGSKTTKKASTKKEEKNE